MQPSSLTNDVNLRDVDHVRERRELSVVGDGPSEQVLPGTQIEPANPPVAIAGRDLLIAARTVVAEVAPSVPGRLTLGLGVKNEWNAAEVFFFP